MMYDDDGICQAQSIKPEHRAASQAARDFFFIDTPSE